MRASHLLLAAAALAPRLQAQIYTLSPLDGGSSTLFTYDFRDTVWTTSSVVLFTGSMPSISVSSLRSSAAFYLNPQTTAVVVDGIPNLTLENLTTGATATYSSVQLLSTTSNPRDVVAIKATASGLAVSNGDLIRLTPSSTLTGTLVLPYAYGNLNPGTYANGDLLINATPVPEPSTYGLILGGLALAGAAIRRRRKTARD